MIRKLFSYCIVVVLLVVALSVVLAALDRQKESSVPESVGSEAIEEGGMSVPAPNAEG